MSAELILKLETDKPSESVQKKALLELRETPENIEKGLRELKTLLEAEKNMITPITNDEWLLMFLRTCKFYPESARDLIKSFYNIRHKYPEVNNSLVPSKLKHVFDANLVSILPHRDQHGRRIIVSICGKQWNYSAISITEIFSSSTLCLDLLQKEPETQISGIVYIMDLDGFSIWHALQYTPHVVKRFMDFIQHHSPLRVKGFHIVNQPKIFVPIFNSVKPILTAKFRKRLIMHGKTYESLHQYISPECLPNYYGGTLETKLMYGHETHEILADYEELFKDLQKYGLKTQNV